MSGPVTEPREALAEVRDALICPDCGVTYKQLVAMCNRHIRSRSEGSGLDALREATEAVVREARDLAGYRSGGLPITPGLDVALRKYDAALAAQEEASDD